MDKEYFAQERDFYLDEMLQNIVPFWLKHARDEECGGYYVCLRRDGSVFDVDKVSTWGLGRIAWSFGYLYNNLRPEPEWLDMATHGIEFTRRHGFDESGHIYGSLTRGGRPLAGASDIYHDLFAAQAFAECWKATGDKEVLGTAKRLTFSIDELLDKPKTNPYRPYAGSTRPMSVHPEYLILLETVQLLRDLDDDPRHDQIAAKCVDRILSLHYNEEARAVFELVSMDGSPLAPWMGRWVCPGHMCELAWMLIHEGEYRNRDELTAKGLRVADWAMEWGWDKENGGIPNDVNIDGEYCMGGRLSPYAPLKLWWQMLEAIHANLIAYCTSQEPKFCERYEMVRDWSFEHFADPEYGEWYGILSPEGRLIDGGAKATDIKSCQHTIRTFYQCYRLAQREAAGVSS